MLRARRLRLAGRILRAPQSEFAATVLRARAEGHEMLRRRGGVTMTWWERVVKDVEEMAMEGKELPFWDSEALRTATRPRRPHDAVPLGRLDHGAGRDLAGAHRGARAEGVEGKGGQAEGPAKRGPRPSRPMQPTATMYGDPTGGGIRGSASKKRGRMGETAPARGSRLAGVPMQEDDLYRHVVSRAHSAPPGGPMDRARELPRRGSTAQVEPGSGAPKTWRRGGIANLGNTCFLTAAVVAMYATATIRTIIGNGPETSTSRELADMFQHLESGGTEARPEGLLRTLRGGMFHDGRQHDASEAFNGILEALEEGGVPCGAEVAYGQVIQHTCLTCGHPTQRTQELWGVEIPVGDEFGELGVAIDSQVEYSHEIMRFCGKDRCQGMQARATVRRTSSPGTLVVAVGRTGDGEKNRRRLIVMERTRCLGEVWRVTAMVSHRGEEAERGHFTCDIFGDSYVATVDDTRVAQSRDKDLTLQDRERDSHLIVLVREGEYNPHGAWAGRDTVAGGVPFPI